MAYTIFIDGETGPTGLQIRDRLQRRADLKLMHLTDARRKVRAARREALNEADLAILCLPDASAKEAISMIENPHTRVIDTSTAHRISDGWVYGFPELNTKQSMDIASAARVTNPGCYATGFIALLRPLVDAGLVPADHPITSTAVSGYTGGGKVLIARMEDPANVNPIVSDFFAYSLGLEHKHVPEMQIHARLAHRPLFVPSVGRFRQGMLVKVPLHLWALPSAPSVETVYQTLADYYSGCRFIIVPHPLETTDRVALLDPEEVNNTNELRLYVFGNPEHGQLVLVSQLDNLGKGASGQAIQCLNVMLGLNEATGLMQEPT